MKMYLKDKLMWWQLDGVAFYLFRLDGKCLQELLENKMLCGGDGGQTGKYPTYSYSLRNRKTSPSRQWFPNFPT